MGVIITDLQTGMKQQFESSTALGPIDNAVSHKSATYSDSAQAKPLLYSRLRSTTMEWRFSRSVRMPKYQTDTGGSITCGLRSHCCFGTFRWARFSGKQLGLAKICAIACAPVAE